jgi:D-alanine transaminase
MCNAEEAKISIFARGYLFSDGIYELIPYFNSKSFLFDGHYLRLEQSLKMIALENPYTKKEWVSRINEITSSCKYKNFSLYIQVTRGIPENFNDNN